MSNPTRQRRIRWGLRGALVLAALSIVLGTMFNLIIAIASREVPAEAGLGFWAWFLLQSALAWGLGAVPFGAALGVFASMIWRDDGG
ncbi:MAG: ABC transporter ATP-binding protein [Oscillochloridaceae bacterium umkhey_bin13]